MINKQITLDLNGPILSFIQQPSPQTINSGGSATFVGIATATFPSQDPVNSATNTGSISYRWYVDGYGPLSDGSISSLGLSVTGAATTTISITNAQSPSASGLGLYLLADYVPSAYSQPIGAAVTVGTARSTGNAINDPKSSDIAILTVNPLISITSNPANAEVAEGNFATFTVGASSSDGTPVSVRWLLNGSYLSDNGSTIFGSNTSSLRISLPSVSQNTVSAEISHPTASNSPQTTSSASFNVVAPRSIIGYETFEDDGSTLKSQGFVNLDQQSFQFEPQNGYSSTSIYSSEKDVKVRITLAGAAGLQNGTNRGGCGGVTVLDTTLQKNVEYILKIGSAYGSNDSTVGGALNGGGMTVIYRQAQVLAVSGGGGGAGLDGTGGDGGGAGQEGGRGGGLGEGVGGAFVPTGALGTDGYWQGGLPTPNQSSSGGKLSSCSIGEYWKNIGFSPCQNVGNVQLYNAFGNIFSGSATISRGFKAGLGYRSNGGAVLSTANGAGGSGAYGGDASTGSSLGYRSGGGGGSGYWNGEGTLVSSSRGGNCSTRGYVKIEIAPPPPPAPPPPSPSVQLPPPPFYDVVIRPGDTFCPDPKMPILMSDGTQKRAEDIVVGDEVLTQHEETFEWGSYKVISASIASNVLKYKMIFEKDGDVNELICSDSHCFYVDGRGWTNTWQLNVGDIASGYKLTSIEKYESGDVVRLEIQDAHTYICSGLLSHNIRKIR